MGLFPKRKNKLELDRAEATLAISHVKIFANRHGSVGNDQRLTDAGRKQVEDLRVLYLFEGLGSGALILSSEEERCIETANILSGGEVEVVVDPFMTALAQRPETVEGELDLYLRDQIAAHNSVTGVNGEVAPHTVILSVQQPFMFVLRKHTELRELGVPASAHIAPASYERYTPGSLPQS